VDFWELLETMYEFEGMNGRIDLKKQEESSSYIDITMKRQGWTR